VYGLGTLAGTVLFSETTNSSARLWATDGSDAGTRLLQEVPLTVGTGFRPIGITGNTAWLDVVSPASKFAIAIWRTDGTIAGTTQVRVISDRITTATGSYGLLYQTPSELWSWDPRDLAPVRLASGETYAPFGLSNGIGFTQRSARAGVELWIGDRVRGGGRELEDLAVGPASASPAFLGRLGARVYFAATDSKGDRELWSAREADLVP
jgi:hypothetical protein